MFKHGFPKHWSTLKKLIWIIGAAITGGGGSSGVWKTVTGTLIHLTDALASPVKELSVAIEPQQDLHGYDAPYPAGGSKNLIPDGTNTSNGYVDGKYLQNDGTFYTNSSWYTSEYFPVTAGETYTWSTNGNPNSPSICFYDSSKNFISAIQAAQSLPKTFTVPTGAVYCRASQGKNFDANGQQLELGSTATTPKPYSNICPITGRTGATIYRAGANICDLADAGIGTTSFYNLSSGTITIGGSGATISGTNPITITNNTNWRGAIFFSKPLKAGQTYRLRYRIKGTSNSNIKRTYYLVNKNNAIVNKITSYSEVGNPEEYVYNYGITAVSDGDKIAIVVESSTKQTITIYDLAINYPSTKYDYSSYAGTTYPISWQTEAGTVYGGTLTVNEDGSCDIVSNKLIIDLSAKTYDVTSYTEVVNAKFRSNIDDFNASPISGILSNCLQMNPYPSATIGQRPLYSLTYVKGNYYPSEIKLPIDYNTSAKVKAFFADVDGNGTHGVLVLNRASPVTYHLDSITQITTLAGENNIWADVNGEITLTYQAVPETAFSDNADTGMADYMTLTE